MRLSSCSYLRNYGKDWLMRSFNGLFLLLGRFGLGVTNAIFGGDFLPPFRVNQIASAQLESYKLVEQDHRGHGMTPAISDILRWKKPPAGVTKLNWDAAIDKQGNRMGVGIIARDQNGDVVGAMCLTKPFLTDPATAEAVRVWQSVEFSRQMRLANIVFEGDSLEVVNALKNEDSCWTRYGMMINDAKKGLLCIPKWEVTHVKRRANAVAHTLAKHALIFGENKVWRGITPTCIQDLVFAEKSLSTWMRYGSTISKKIYIYI